MEAIKRESVVLLMMLVSYAVVFLNIYLRSMLYLFFTIAVPIMAVFILQKKITYKDAAFDLIPFFIPVALWYIPYFLLGRDKLKAATFWTLVVPSALVLFYFIKMKSILTLESAIVGAAMWLSLVLVGMATNIYIFQVYERVITPSFLPKRYFASRAVNIEYEMKKLMKRKAGIFEEDE